MLYPPFTHLNVHSGFSFLDGSSSVASLVLAATELGMPALALTDRDSVTGVVSLVQQCAKAGIKPLGGCDLTLEGGHRLTLLMDGPQGWSSLCNILSVTHLRDTERRGPRARWEDIARNTAGLVCLSGGPEQGIIPRLIRQGRYADAEAVARRCLSHFGPTNFAIEVTRTMTEGEYRLSERLFELADYLSVPAVATNGVRFARKAEAAAYEALCRVRLRLAPHEQHAELPFNGERYLKSGSDMNAQFCTRVDAIDAAVHLSQRLAQPLEAGKRHLPRYPFLPPTESVFSLLSRLAVEGAKKRYGESPGDALWSRIRHELETIHTLEFSEYFLVCADICRESRSRGIRCALRGSAMGSVVAYCLGMSDLDPYIHNVSFNRFLSKVRARPPDIDIDFRHDLRDEMMTYVRQTYGEDRVANVANYVCYKGRSLLRDLGKALDFDTSEIDRLRELLWHSRGDDLMERLQSQPELISLGIQVDRYGDLFALCAALSGLPRHLGTHSSGIVVGDVPLAGIAPLQWAAKGVTVIALDKDDVESEGIGLLKIDQLSLRALTAVDIAVGRVRETDPEFDYEGRDREDADTLEMIRAAQTIGVFQLESPAQMALQWRLQADRFDDLIASVALIRPGPLVGGGVTPYVACRKGWRQPTYPLPELEPVLKETFGRILFQDQVMEVVRAVGGYAEGKADVWLKAMTKARSADEMQRLGKELWERASAKGMVKKDFARLWKQIKGFSRYGFNHGHSLAFADHAQGTAYLLRHHPAAFLSSILSVEPYGFWPVATVVEEAKRRGIRVHGPCVNRSEGERWVVENETEGEAIRCSLAFVREVRREAKSIVEERKQRGVFTSLQDFARRCCFVSLEQMEWLTLAGALDSLELNRRRTLWSLSAICSGVRRAERVSGNTARGQQTMPLEVPPYLPTNLPPFTRRHRVAQEWSAMGFSPLAHPLSLYRPALEKSGIQTSEELQRGKDGDTVKVAGLVIRPHRPPTPSGEIIVYLTLEDETGLTQVTVVPDVYESVGSDIFTERILIVQGVLERRGTGLIVKASLTQSVY